MLKHLTTLLITLLLFSCTSEKKAQVKEQDPKEVKVLYESDFSQKNLGTEWNTAFCQKKKAVQEGTLYGAMTKGARHSAIYGLQFDDFKSFEYEIDYKFNNAEWFSINIRDLNYKGSHAGHIGGVKIFQDKIIIQDKKYGYMDFKIKAMKKKDQKTKEYLKTTLTTVNFTSSQNKWHKLKVLVQNSEMKIFIDDKLIAKHKSKCFEHASSNSLAIQVKEESVFFDNLKITKLD